MLKPNKTMAKNKTTKDDMKTGPVAVGEGSTKKGGTILQRKITMKPLQKMPMEATARIAGIVTKTEAVTTLYGESTRLIGDIAMRIAEDGKHTGKEPVIRAGACFLPKAAEGILQAAVQSSINDDDFKGVEFALEIGKQESANSKTGYEWTVKTLVDTAEVEDKVLLLLGA
jgi:hypothetical protein